MFKIFRGSTIVYAAGCDVAVPKQTRAYAAHDRHSLLRATLMAAALCSLPAIILCALLYFAGEWFFSFLLGSAATMPAWLIPVLIGLLLTNLVQTVSNSLLLHTGYFRYLALIAGGMAIAMTLMSIVVATMKLDIVGYLTAYAQSLLSAFCSRFSSWCAGRLRSRRRAPTRRKGGSAAPGLSGDKS